MDTENGALDAELCALIFLVSLSITDLASSATERCGRTTQEEEEEVRETHLLQFSIEDDDEGGGPGHHGPCAETSIREDSDGEGATPRTAARAAVDRLLTDIGERTGSESGGGAEDQRFPAFDAWSSAPPSEQLLKSVHALLGGVALLSSRLAGVTRLPSLVTDSPRFLVSILQVLMSLQPAINLPHGAESSTANGFATVFVPADVVSEGLGTLSAFVYSLYSADPRLRRPLRHCFYNAVLEQLQASERGSGGVGGASARFVSGLKTASLLRSLAPLFGGFAHPIPSDVLAGDVAFLLDVAVAIPTDARVADAVVGSVIALHEALLTAPPPTRQPAEMGEAASGDVVEHDLHVAATACSLATEILKHWSRQVAASAVPSVAVLRLLTHVFGYLDADGAAAVWPQCRSVLVAAAGSAVIAVVSAVIGLIQGPLLQFASRWGDDLNGDGRGEWTKAKVRKDARFCRASVACAIAEALVATKKNSWWDHNLASDVMSLWDACTAVFGGGDDEEDRDAAMTAASSPGAMDVHAAVDVDLTKADGDAAAEAATGGGGSRRGDLWRAATEAACGDAARRDAFLRDGRRLLHEVRQERERRAGLLVGRRDAAIAAITRAAEAGALTHLSFVFGKVLGVGSFGVVRAGRFIEPDVPQGMWMDVAVKELHKGDLALRAQAAARADAGMMAAPSGGELRAHRALSRLSPDGVVPFFASFQSAVKLYIVTDVMPNGDLFAVISGAARAPTAVDTMRSSPKFLPWAKAVAWELCCTVWECHQGEQEVGQTEAQQQPQPQLVGGGGRREGWSLGDIKAENIVFSSAGLPKLIDFDEANSQREVEAAKGISPRQVLGGTLLVMAPEVLRHNRAAMQCHQQPSHLQSATAADATTTRAATPRMDETDWGLSWDKLRAADWWSVGCVLTQLLMGALPAALVAQHQAVVAPLLTSSEAILHLYESERDRGRQSVLLALADAQERRQPAVTTGGWLPGFLFRFLDIDPQVRLDAANQVLTDSWFDSVRAAMRPVGSRHLTATEFPSAPPHSRALAAAMSSKSGRQQSIAVHQQAQIYAAPTPPPVGGDRHHTSVTPPLHRHTGAASMAGNWHFDDLGSHDGDDRQADYFAVAVQRPVREGPDAMPTYQNDRSLVDAGRVGGVDVREYATVIPQGFPRRHRLH